MIMASIDVIHVYAIAIIIVNIKPNFIFGNDTELFISNGNDKHLLQFTSNLLNECLKCDTILTVYINGDSNANSFLDTLKNKRQSAFFTLKLDNLTATLSGEYPNYFPDVTIIFLNEYTYDLIEEVIFAIEILPCWHIRASFLLVLTGSVALDDEYFKNTFDSFWSRLALRVFIFYWNTDVKVVTYNPFFDNYAIEVSNITTGMLHRPVSNMNGYPIKLYHFDIVLKNNVVRIHKDGKEILVGFDGMFLSAVTEAMNATLEMRLLSEDIDEETINAIDPSLPISNFVRTLQELYDFDALFNSLRIYDNNDLDHVFLYERNDLFIVVPKGKQIPQYLYIFMIVPMNVWFAVFISLITVSLTVILIRKCFPTKIDMVNIFLNNYRLLLSQSFPALNKRPQEQFLFILWGFLCIIFGTLFQSVLMTTLVKPKYYTDVDTLSELYETDIRVYVADMMRIQITKEVEKENNKLVEHLVSLPKEKDVYGETLDYIVEYSYDSGMIITQRQIYELKRRNRDTFRSTYHVMKESPMPNAIAFNMPPEKLYYREFQDIIGRIQDSGLHIHWRSYNYGVKEVPMENKTVVSEQRSNSDRQALTLSHLQSAFVILLFGSGVSISIFFFECIYQKIRKQ